MVSDQYQQCVVSAASTEVPQLTSAAEGVIGSCVRPKGFTIGTQAITATGTAATTRAGMTAIILTGVTAGTQVSTMGGIGGVTMDPTAANTTIGTASAITTSEQT